MSEKKNEMGRNEPVRRYDRPGHLHPAHAARLLALSRAGREHPDDSEFLRTSAEEDDLASELGETTLVSMTSGDAAFMSDLAAPVPEEMGGPFVVTRASDELAEALEERNPLDAPRANLLAQEGAASRAPRSWPSLSLPRVQKIAEWFGKRWSGR
jgi:hypothetical protein